MEWDAIVLAGGRAERMGGGDKAAVEVAGRSLMARTLEALGAARQVVVVGPGPVPAGVTLVREDPPFGGPAAAVGAGLAQVGAEWTLVAACDHPYLAEGVPLLLAGRDDGDGTVLESPDGRRQLVIVVRTDALRRAAARLRDLSGASMGALLHGLDLIPVAAGPRAATDIDTWDDVTSAEGQLDD